ncbi:MAG: hypothetical protein ACRDDZ_08180 [Marinifilaceae bacterium]
MNNLFNNFLKWLYPRRRGVMGTVIIHLLAAITLLSMELSKGEQHMEAMVVVEAPAPKKIEEKKQEEKKREEVKQKTSNEEVEKLLKSLAMNENAPKEKRSDANRVQEYIDEMEKDIDRRGYGNKYKKDDNKNYKKDSLQNKQDQQQAQLDSLKSTFYAGKSSVSYNLKDRFARNMPIPVFKCEFGGTVVVTIEVDQRGVVQRAQVQESASAKDDCLLEVATDAALRSRFNAKADAPQRQLGTITYRFVKQ